MKSQSLYTRLQFVINSYQKIAEPRRRFKIFFWLSVVIIVLATVAEVILEDNPTLVAKIFGTGSKIVIAISTSLAAAALIEIFSGMRDVWIREQTQKDFRAFFGCEYEKKTVAVVIPRFPMKELKGKFPEVFETDLDPSSQAVKRLSEVSDMVLAYGDVKTASDILIAFTQVGLLDRVEMYWDDDLLEKWEAGKEQRIRTFIIVGLYSNRFFWAIYNATSMRQLFKINQGADGSFDFSIAKHIGNAQGWHSPREAEPGKQDHILISKVHMNPHQKAFIVGGITAQGTERIGQFLRENWKTLYDWTDSDLGSHISVKDHEFAMSISMPLPEGVPAPKDCYIYA
jgi:hypothetical protein